MTPEIMRQYLAAHAPELEVVELPEAHTTEYISREWKVLPAQVSKTLTLRVGEDAIIVVTCGDSRLDNRKVKKELGGKGQMMPGSEASEITGHAVGAITPLCLGSLLPVFFDIGLKRFEEVVTAGGSTHAAIRIPLTRFAQLTGATWVDVCKEMQGNGEQDPTSCARSEFCMTTLAVTDWKKEWFEIEDATYLNTAAHTVMPRVSISAVERSLEGKKFPHRVDDSLWFEAPVRIRASLSQMIGAKPEEIAVTSGASAGAAVVAYGLEWKRGDEIITVQREFPLQYATWKPMEEREGVRLRVIAPRERFITADDLIDSLAPATRIVSVSLVRYDDGSCWTLPDWLPLVMRRGRCFCWMSVKPAAPCQ